MTNTSVPKAILALVSVAAPYSHVSAAPLATCPVSNGQLASYDIVRSGNVIGHETLRFAISGPDTTVTVDVNAAVRMLGIRVYNYEHHSEERWRAGQLVAIVSRTNDDGTPRHVDASRNPDGTWRGTTGPQPGPAPLLPTSLWNIQTVNQTRLLDRETGEIVPVHTAPSGDDTLHAGTRDIAASKFTMSGLVTGNVWYDSRGCWVGARFNTRVDHSVIEVRAE